MYSAFLKYAEKAARRIIYYADLIFTPKYNPFYYLGAIAITFLTMIFISGVYMFIFYKIATPYDSVKYITEGQWHIGAVIRSIHRYASAGLVVTGIFHLLHIFFTDRYRHWRTIAWLSGIAVLGAIWFTGVVGYWLVWDERAQMIAQFTTEFLDHLPIFKGTLSLSFAKDQLVTGMFFFIALLVHLFIPVFLFFLLWVHVMRLSKPVLTPPRNMAYMIGGFILLLSIVKPVVNLLPANSRKIIAITGIDWFYLFIFPVINSIPVWLTWVSIVSSLAFLTAIPWLKRTKRATPAVIMQEKCTGCSLCFNDCPYDAIHIRPRTDGKPFELEAIVMPERCAGCGICVGSCSFDGVVLPDKTASYVLEEIKRALDEIRNSKRPAILGLGCSYSVDPLIPSPLTGEGQGGGEPGEFSENIRYIKLPCVGMIHRSWIEYAFGSGAGGVFVLGCRMNDCQYRFGNKWIDERFAYERSPRLNRSVDKSKIKVFWMAQAQKKELMEGLRNFEKELGGETQEIRSKKQEVRNKRVEVRRRVCYALSTVSLVVPAFLIIYFSELPYVFTNSGESRLVVSVRHTSSKVANCDDMAIINKEAERFRESFKNSKRIQMQLGKIGDCARERNPVFLELYIDNKMVLSRDYFAGGIKSDGPSFAFEKFTVKPGVHNVIVMMRDSRTKDHFDYSVNGEVEFKAGYIRVVDFDEIKKQLRIS
ncbi:MAG: hydrogenase iron-sulfur subunit [Nitrospirae bacterium]|nr:hydrogenase iron-sulfur subunit [Nitrospirota bacterium]